MTESGKFVGPCYKCKSEIWLPDTLYASCKRSSKISFWCSYGHEQIFAEGETQEAVLRRERDLLAQRIAMKDDEIRAQAKLVENLKQQRKLVDLKVNKMTKRASAGVCLHCNRQFQNVLKHMENKHHQYRAEQVQ